MNTNRTTWAQATNTYRARLSMGLSSSYGLQVDGLQVDSHQLPSRDRVLLACERTSHATALVRAIEMPSDGPESQVDALPSCVGVPLLVLPITGPDCMQQE